MYSVVEIFTSLQGEGRFVGYPVNFIRLAGCSMGCKFCDTDIKEREVLTAEDILTRLNRDYSRRVVITGGEPLEQRYGTTLLASTLITAGYLPHLETNGALAIPECYFHWVSLSPKKLKRPPARNYTIANEVKWLVPLWSFDEVMWHVDAFAGRARELEHYVQPINDHLEINKKALQMCLEYIARSAGQLKLSVQLHKLIGVR